MLFKRKNEFRPDKNRSGALNILYITKKQRTTVLKWLLMTVALVVICIVQDVLLSRLQLWGTTFDLMAVTLLLVCILLDPEVGSIFILVGALVYQFSGSAPGPYVIILLTIIGVLCAIVRHCYLQSNFSSALICTAIAILFYELALFCVGIFSGAVTWHRITTFLIKAGLSTALIPLMYPIFSAICNIGGEAWNE